MTQQGDVLLYQTNDGGDITVENGLVEMSGGLETAAYLSLFGGNEQDDGRDDNRLTWWGNLIENEPARQYRGELQYLLRRLPAIPANLRRLEDAAVRDLTWLVDTNAATQVRADASLTERNRVKLTVSIEASGTLSTIEFTENWRADSES